MNRGKQDSARKGGGEETVNECVVIIHLQIVMNAQAGEAPPSSCSGEDCQLTGPEERSNWCSPQRKMSIFNPEQGRVVAKPSLAYRYFKMISLYAHAACF